MEPVLMDLCELCRNSMLPEQHADIGSELFDSKYFDKYRIQLNQNLHRIFDILNDRQNDILFMENVSDSVRFHLTLLYLEQSAKHAVYQSDERMLTQNIEALGPRIRDYLAIESVRNDVFTWYKNRISGGKWKRNTGASHSLAMYCEILHTQSDLWKITMDDGLFLLSAGTLMLEHFDHVYKELGLTILLCALSNLSIEDIVSTNIHEPIFDICKQNVSIVKDLHINHLLWTCLIECLRLKPACQLEIPSTWNHRDDVCSALLTRLAFESDSRLRLMLLRCLSDVFAPDNHLNLLNATNEQVFGVDLQQLRETANMCLVAGRWSKKLVKIWSYHVSCSFGPSEDIALNLRIVHICYLLCLFGVPPTMIVPELREFMHEFPTHLLQLVQYNDGAKEIMHEVDELLQTFAEHLVRADHSNLRDNHSQFFTERSKTLNIIKNALLQRSIK